MRLVKYFALERFVIAVMEKKDRCKKKTWKNVLNFMYISRHAKESSAIVFRVLIFLVTEHARSDYDIPEECMII